MGQADALSRLICLQPRERDDHVIATVKIESEVQQILAENVRSLPVTADTVRQETSKDETLKQVMRYVLSGWPNTDLPSNLQPFHNRRESLSIVGNCLMFGERVVVPATLQKLTLRQFHTGHPGSSRMKALARSFAYWPKMDAEIEDFCRKCKSCQLAAKAPARSPWQPWPQAEKPWERLHLDFAGPINNQMYLIVVDSYTKRPDVIPMRVATSQSTIHQLKNLFHYFGAPEVIVTDNGTQFSSTHFADLCQTYGILHKFCPPYHPQSNGQAERFVDTFKRALRKSGRENPTPKVIQEFLVMYRNTPNPNVPDGKSPAEALFGRQLKTIHDAMIHQKENASVEQDKVQARRAIRRFDPGDQVYARNYSGSV